MTNQLWATNFQNAEVINQEVATLDHTTKFLNLLPATSPGKRRFCSENSWLLETDCKEVVSQSWYKEDVLDIQSRIEKCGQKLQLWGGKVRERFKPVISQTREHIKRLKKIRNDPMDVQITEAKEKLEALLSQEEDFWKQRARIFWLKLEIQTQSYSVPMHLLEKEITASPNSRMMRETLIHGDMAYKSLF